MRKQNPGILICCLGTETKWFARLWKMKAELCEFVVNPGLHSETSSPGGEKKKERRKKNIVFSS